MKGIIDRFEGEFAVVEVEKKMVNIPRSIMPQDIKEGDVIDIGIAVDKSGTDRAKKEIEDLMKAVWKE